jgi:hypothetical protein
MAETQKRERDLETLLEKEQSTRSAQAIVDTIYSVTKAFGADVKQ